MTFNDFTEELVGLVIHFLYIGKTSIKAVITLATKVMKKLGRTLEKGAKTSCVTVSSNSAASVFAMPVKTIFCYTGRIL